MDTDSKENHKNTLAYLQKHLSKGRCEKLAQYQGTTMYRILTGDATIVKEDLAIQWTRNWSDTQSIRADKDFMPEVLWKFENKDGRQFQVTLVCHNSLITVQCEFD